MDKKFNEKARKIIAEYLGCNVDDVYCVWSCKTLQHIKGLFSSDVANAKGLYWEVTYNGIKNELYIDRCFRRFGMNVKKYRKKPEEVLAVRYTPETIDDCVKFLENGNAKYSITFDEQGEAELKILIGRVTKQVVYGDYIFRDEYGEYFLSKSHDFGLIYEPIEKYGDMFIEINSAITNSCYAVNIDDIMNIKRDVDMFGKEATIIEKKFGGGFSVKEKPEEILNKIANAGVNKNS